MDGQRYTRILTPCEEHVLSGYSAYGAEELDLVEGQNRWGERVAAEAEVITESRCLVEGRQAGRKDGPFPAKVRTRARPRYVHKQ